MTVKRILDFQGTGNKRRYIRWDHDRARDPIERDYWTPIAPLFDDRMFERTFRVTKQIANIILQLAGSSDPFFSDRVDGLGKRGICPNVKFLMGLKLMAYGCSPSAFMDYFQMGETAARQCLLRLCTVLSSHPDLTSVYLRAMSRNDARNISRLHEEQHGVSGMIGCLDCMHVLWKNCPVAWQGQTTGKEKKPTIVLEAFTDHNLFFWHASFG